MKTRHAVVAVALAAGGLLPMEQVTSAPRPDPGAERTGNVFAKPQPGVPGSQRPTREAALAAAAAAPDAADTAGGRALMHNSLIDLVPCDDDPAFLCGTLRVRFDRRLPNGPRLNLHVEVFPHQGPAPQADGAVFVTEGGPGFSVSLFAKYDYAFFLLEDVAQTRDLVFVDQRGVGLSDVIDCPQWQHGGPFYRSAKRCHDQLGDVASRYSTTDVADDLNAVRKALNYKRIDLVGGSYAGTDMLTYTVRHKPHVRSVVLGAPVVLPGMDTFFPYTPEAFPHVVNGLCGRSPGCAAENPDPDGSLAWLAARLRRHPVSGTGIDSMGVPHEITVTENLLAFAMMAFTGPSFVGPGEIAQAAEALRNGDKTPLLRLAADVDPANGFDSGDPREYSNGHNLARLCVDAPLQWNKQAPLWRRLRQYVAAFRDAPDFFGPISKRGWAHPGYVGRQPAECIASRWEDRPNFPAGTTVSGVSALVITGEYDLVVPTSLARRATEVLVGAEFVDMAAAGHVPWWYSDCGRELVQRFIATRSAGDTSCADEPAGGWWMPGSFPKTVGEAPPADQASGPTASLGIRRLATVVAWTVMDGIQHNFSVPVPVSASLRGGTVTFDREAEVTTLTFDHARFTTDVRVDGTVVWPDVLDGDFVVRGPGGATRTVHLNGPFIETGEDVTVTIQVQGQPATFTVPGY